MDELGPQPWEGLPTLQLGLTQHILVGGKAYKHSQHHQNLIINS